MSTAKLPDARLFITGHSTGMARAKTDLKSILARVDQRLEAMGLTDSAASKAAGKPDAIRNMRRAVKEGRHGANSTTITALAHTLKASASWLMTGEGALDYEEEQGPTVAIVGYVGASSGARGAIYRYAVGQGELERIPAPDGATSGTVAVEVRGTSLGKVFDRWLVFYDEVRKPVTADLIGELCVVGLSDDRVLIKQIKPGRREGLYNLESADPEEPTIQNTPVEWAAKVQRMLPKWAAQK